MTTDEDEIKHLTKESVLYFISQHAKNSTIKRSDFVKCILSDANRRTQNEVIKQTKDTLKKVSILISNNYCILLLYLINF